MNCLESIVGDFTTSKEKMSIEWRIPKWRVLFSDGDNDLLASPSFHFCGSLWCVDMWLNDETGENVGLYLGRKEEGPPVIIHFTFGIKGRYGVENEREDEDEFSDGNDYFGFSDFLPRSQLKSHKSRLMNENVLTITCELKKRTYSTDRGDQCETVPSIPPNLEVLSVDLGCLLESGTLADVELKCGGRVLRAHRCVLAARSKVFAAMFLSDMRESRTGVIHITDLDGDVADAFLRYLYEGRVQSEVSDVLVPRLYEAADKYGVGALKDACRERMTGALDESNCVGLLGLADAHRDDTLKKAAVAFICGHKPVLESDAWKNFSERFPTLAIEVYRSYVQGKE